MKPGNPELPPRCLGLEQAAWRLDEGQLLQFTADGGFRLYQYVDMGETDMRVIRAGESDYVLRAPLREPVLVHSAASLAELLDADGQAPRPADGPADVGDPDIEVWAASLPTPEDIEEAARAELDERPADLDAETIPCGNCKGDMHFEFPCSCTEGGTTFVDMTGEPDEPVVSLREKGVPAPDCGTCEGTGMRQADCMYCAGCGEVEKYPRMVLINEVTGQTADIRLDLAALVVGGEVEIRWEGLDRRHSPSLVVAERVISFDVPAYIGKRLTALGVDIDNAAKVRGDSVTGLTLGQTVAGGRAYWRKRDGEVITGFNDGESTLTAAEILVAAQKNLARAHAWPQAKIPDADGKPVEEWRIRPLRPLEEALDDLKTALAEQGYTLGLMQSFIATGETGPSFYLLDANGNSLGQLSNDYEVRDALENAWLALQKMKPGRSGRTSD